MRMFHWLARVTCTTFAVSLVSVLGGQVASLYGYFYFYGYSYIHGDTSVLEILPNRIIYALVLVLALVHSALQAVACQVFGTDRAEQAVPLSLAHGIPTVPELLFHRCIGFLAVRE